MNKTKIEWVKNPDGTQGYTWNPITGCNNQIDGMCQGGNFPCYAYRLANGRLRNRYLANKHTATHNYDEDSYPFYPRFWEDRLYELDPTMKSKHFTVGGASKVQPKGIFVCDMSDLFGIGIPEEWTRRVIEVIKMNPYHRFYLLTKQPQNLIKFSPFPDNCWVGVTATYPEQLWLALEHFKEIKASIKYISFEPLLDSMFRDDWFPAKYTMKSLVNWVIIGSQTSPKKLPKWEWIEEILNACDKARVSVFLKNNLGLPKLNYEGAMPFYRKDQMGTMVLRQEMPKFHPLNNPPEKNRKEIE